MSFYLHHVPGRLRLRMPELRGKRIACDDAKRLAGSIPGVIEAEANPITGSLLVFYDEQRLTPELLWRRLCAHRLVAGPSRIAEGVRVTRAAPQLPAAAGTLGQIRDRVTATIVNELMARSAALLLEALI